MESPAIAKRKPPSQRPERKLDETAKAIARAREEAKPDRSSDEPSVASDDARPHRGHIGNILGPKKTSGPAPSPSTKRPKTGGGG
jgi:hypothetical protein